jgi:RNA polymerase sigma-70 factor, ECF subfamily
MSSPDLADADLLRQVAEGDEAALRTLMDRHVAWLRMRLSRRVGDPDVVADVLQDTFVAVWRSASRWRGDGEVGAWIWGIAIRRLVSRLRSQAAQAAPSPVSAEVLDSAADPVISAEDEVLLAVEHGDVGMALNQLSPELRRVVQATLVDGLTTREAARMLGIPQGTVKGRLRAARSALRAQVAPVRRYS